ncbi:MAG: PIN domain protein [uncultured Sphingomonas sp.]|uniref:Ribonuclease VapC n=1 Tax=uncultured Sphingomonas sp. TaxID=158754 RepID=A0A6J4SYA0_9SPHN|nr:type II toxin-antitoxin system VapC family toxin [uncultured Sphingomonas sp.]CAA9508937.1 MAG: PIN domain protein [uncultured Sphingomonas sp.]
MILVDTSIWIDHINKGANEQLGYLLDGEGVLTHELIIGEVAMGPLKNRRAQLLLLDDLHRLLPASDHEVRTLVESAGLHGTGLSYVDAHLLAAVRASSPHEQVRLWTRDKKLRAQAERLKVAYEA